MKEKVAPLKKRCAKWGVSFTFSAGLDRPVVLKAMDEEGSRRYERAGGRR